MDRENQDYHRQYDTSDKNTGKAVFGIYSRYFR